MSDKDKSAKTLQKYKFNVKEVSAQDTVCLKNVFLIWL